MLCLGLNVSLAMPPMLSHSPVWFAIGVMVGIAAFVRGFRLLQRRRLILDVPRSKVRSAAVGLVELRGRAVGPYTFPAPATGEDCFLHWTIGWRLADGKYTKTIDERRYVLFFLEDETGRALIDPAGAELHLQGDFDEELGSMLVGELFPAAVRHLVERYGLSPS